MTGPAAPAADSGEALWVVAPGVILLVGGCLVVAAGALSAVLFGGGLVVPHTRDVGTIIHRTLANPSRPAAAWPPALAARMPGPQAYWARRTGDRRGSGPC
jgi:hypothetical protein